MMGSRRLKAGSSPRVRGKRRRRWRRWRRRRLIPACAGKTQVLSQAGFPDRAHPRVCGENRMNHIHVFQGVGSSPRVRGKLTTAKRNVLRRRLIPACAGKTCDQDYAGVVSRAHPRVCGENVRAWLYGIITAGSSPRVRGKRDLRVARAARVGLIPACAGKTSSSASWWTKTWAHPRVCGENLGIVGSTVGLRGSSPRVRGKHRLVWFVFVKCGLIPACAGKTQSKQVPHNETTAHPRVCGENCVGKRSWFVKSGSSPRVRGKPPTSTRYILNMGLIPACAGKTGKAAGRY